MVNITSVNEVVGGVQGYVQEIAIGIVILLAGFGLGILIKKVLQRTLPEMGLNKVMGKVGITLNVEQLISSITPYIIYLFTVVIFLDHFGVASIVLWSIAGGMLILIILTLAVGLKDVIPNFLGGIAIQKNSAIKEGKHIEIKELSCVIEHAGYLETKIKPSSGDVLYVPNSLLSK